jgi:hypothetical protein
LAPWLKAAKVVAWVSLVVVIDVTVGRALQLAAANLGSRAASSELAQPVDGVGAPGGCQALDKYVHRSMTIDELHDLQDGLCLTRSEPQRTGN